MQERTALVLSEALRPRPSQRIEDSAYLQRSALADHNSILLKDREEWQLACRVIASRGFRKSDLLQRFLLEVCELTLTGRAREITEQYIGIRIFGRPEGYDPGEDNIVRNYARMLRKRLDAYFADEGAHEPLRLTVPRGGYVPVFAASPGSKKPVASETLPEQSEEVALVPSVVAIRVNNEPAERKPWKWAACGAVAGALLALLLWSAIYAVQMHMHRSPAHALWAQLFEKKRNTLIVPTDSGLGILENLTRTEASLDNYVNGTYFARLRTPAELDTGGFNDLTGQRYTSAVSLGISTALARLPEFTADRTQVRFARNLAVEETRNANMILIGSVHSNPWIALFEPRLNFQFVYTPEVDRSYIVNRRPQTGERMQYTNGAADGRAPTYGTVAYLPDGNGTGHVLIVEGLSMAGTQAAANILFDGAAIQPVLHAAAAPGGRLRAFEVLVETTSVDASASAARIIATRVYPET